jgi:AraC-like DNA-binding protein
MASPLQDHVWHDGLDGLVMHYRVRPLREHHEHRHTELEFNLIVAGHGAYRTPDRRYDLGPDTAAWIFPGTDHRMVRTSPGFAIWVVAIRAAALRRHLGGRFQSLDGTAPPGRWHRTLAPGDVHLLTALLHELHTAHDDPLRFNHGLRFFVAQAWTAFTRAPEDPAQHPAVAAVLRALRTAPDLPPSALVHAAGVGQRRLTALIRAETGAGLIALRNRVRVELALTRAHHDRDLGAAALAAGFTSYRQFHRACRQVTGTAPRVARREAHRQHPGIP